MSQESNKIIQLIKELPTQSAKYVYNGLDKLDASDKGKILEVVYKELGAKTLEMFLIKPYDQTAYTDLQLSFVIDYLIPFLESKGEFQKMINTKTLNRAVKVSDKVFIKLFENIPDDQLSSVVDNCTVKNVVLNLPQCWELLKSKIGYIPIKTYYDGFASFVENTCPETVKQKFLELIRLEGYKHVDKETAVVINLRFPRVFIEMVTYIAQNPGSEASKNLLIPEVMTSLCTIWMGRQEAKTLVVEYIKVASCDELVKCIKVVRDLRKEVWI